MKKLFIAAALLSAATLGATSAALAQGYSYGTPQVYGQSYGQSYGNDRPGYRYYDYAPGYSGYGGDNFDNDRVDGPGRGNSAESQR
jgi:hypothetical protein